jgi:hypothetical protein
MTWPRTGVNDQRPPVERAGLPLLPAAAWRSVSGQHGGLYRLQFWRAMPRTFRVEGKGAQAGACAHRSARCRVAPPPIREAARNVGGKTRDQRHTRARKEVTQWCGAGRMVRSRSLLRDQPAAGCPDDARQAARRHLFRQPLARLGQRCGMDRLVGIYWRIRRGSLGPGQWPGCDRDLASTRRRPPRHARSRSAAVSRARRLPAALQDGSNGHLAHSHLMD